MAAQVTSVEVETRYRIKLDPLPVRRNAQGRLIEGLTVLVGRPEQPWRYVVYLDDDQTYFAEGPEQLERLAPGMFEQVVAAMGSEDVRRLRP